MAKNTAAQPAGFQPSSQRKSGVQPAPYQQAPGTINAGPGMAPTMRGAPVGSYNPAFDQSLPGNKPMMTQSMNDQRAFAGQGNDMRGQMVPGAMPAPTTMDPRNARVAGALANALRTGLKPPMGY